VPDRLGGRPHFDLDVVVEAPLAGQLPPRLVTSKSPTLKVA
jgi:hypothetical protein